MKTGAASPATPAVSASVLPLFPCPVFAGLKRQCRSVHPVYSRISTSYDWIQSILADRAAAVPAPANVTCGADLNHPGWYGPNAPERSCRWFAADPTSRCAEYDDRVNGGLSADAACCACARLDPSPETREAAGDDGGASIGVTFRYAGEYAAVPRGPTAAVVTRGVIPVADKIVLYEFDFVGVAAFRAFVPLEEERNLDLDLVRRRPRDGDHFLR